MIPGSNLLNMALTVIRPQTIQFFAFTGRATNAIGLDEATYAAPVAVRGSVQPVPRSQYQRMGLDYNKRYVNLYASTDIDDLARDTAGDQIEFNGRRYEIMGEDDWFPQDGWNGTLAVDIGAATP